ncbi:MAG: hypothetical protein LBC98_09760 [Prevotellaceae bacterium]|jgi:hypothetical protein|nr:hypothetical protein [Prevotellaceae bacterium]
MKKIVYILIFALSATLFTPLKAQTLTLSDKEQAEFKERINTMLETFLNDLSSIGSKDNSIEFKKAVIKSTLRNFINNGDPYRDSSGYLKKEPHMQTSVLRNGKEYKNKLPIKTYLNNLMYIRYEKVTITMSETLYLSNLYKVGDHYEANATYFQYFRGEHGDGRLYQDKTKKTIRIIVQIEEVYGKKVFVVRFGDIDVVQTVA